MKHGIYHLLISWRSEYHFYKKWPSLEVMTSTICSSLQLMITKNCENVLEAILGSRLALTYIDFFGNIHKWSHFIKTERIQKWSEKIFGMVNSTNELVNPPKFHQNPRFCHLPFCLWDRKTVCQIVTFSLYICNCEIDWL